VLGMEAVLALALVIFGVLLTRAESVVALLIALVVIAGAGTLFWKLVKVMARIQMPERPGQDR
jgi:divalent metal cation (Fe/Co/Zn/Cd) transporter